MYEIQLIQILFFSWQLCFNLDKKRKKYLDILEIILL